MLDVDQQAGRVTAADVDKAAAGVIAVLGQGLSADWDVRAGDLDWSCRATVEHIASDLVAYAAQLTARATSAYVPFDVVLDNDADPLGFLQVIQATAGLLSAAVRTAPTALHVWHPFGMADAEAAAAMGIVELLVHTHDICQGLSLTWTPPPGVSNRVLARLFPHTPPGHDAWPTLLWATGRTELPGHPRQTRWRWYNQHPCP